MKKKPKIVGKGITCKHCIVKRKGHLEEFDERKIYSSCYAAALSAGIPHRAAEKLCGDVCSDLKKWLDDKYLVTSDQIFRKTTALMKKHDKKASFMYETHRDIA